MTPELIELVREYEAWLDTNPNVPRGNADEVMMALCASPPQGRPAAINDQIDWLLNFIDRWDAAQ